jgi:hypothetical protein
MNKKAQLEIIGLIFIVIIVVAAMLFYVAYKVSHPEVSVRQSFISKEVASNILITSLNTNVEECKHHTLDQLVSDCANVASRRIFCGTETSCIAANRTLNKMIGGTFDFIGKDYYLASSIPDISSENKCAGKERIQAQQSLTISLGTGTVALTLDVCDAG